MPDYFSWTLETQTYGCLPGRHSYYRVSSVTALPSAVHDQKRVALVIGNSAYETDAVLANPRNDAADVAAVLESRGFLVIE